MKTCKFILALLFLPFAMLAQAGSDTLFIHTSAQCGTCKQKIEHDMAYVKGVRKVELDLSTKNLLIVFNPDKTNPGKLRMALTKIGYDADSLAADPKAYDRLIDCCKKGGHD